LSILKSAGLYYQFPDIGFMQMFPRLDGVARSKGIRTSLLSFGNEVVDAVQTEWWVYFKIIVLRFIQQYCLGSKALIISTIHGRMESGIRFISADQISQCCSSKSSSLLTIVLIRKTLVWDSMTLWSIASSSHRLLVDSANC
jgi:hypothetical protein